MDNSWVISDLNSSQKALLGCIEILSCPSISILPEFPSSKDAHSVYSMEMENLLAQHAKEFMRSTSPEAELSLEFCYVSEAVDNQPYAAKIRNFIIVRVIESNVQRGNELLLEALQRFESLLRAETYFCQVFTGEEYLNLLETIKVSKTMALLR